MRIGIDARPLVENKGGIRRYLFEILNVWSKNLAGHEFFLMSHKEFELTEELSVMKKIVVRGKSGLLWIQYAIPYLLAKYKIDIFWSPNYTIPLYKLTNIKYVMTIHDMIPFVYPDTLPVKTVYHNLFGLPLYSRNADRIITVSDSSKRDIIKYLDYPDSQIQVTPLAANGDFSNPNNADEDVLIKYGIDFPYILSVGTLEPRKNLLRLIEAYKKLISVTSFKHKLVVVGPKGWKYSPIFDSLKNQQDILDRIIFLGYLSDKELSDIYRGASMFVYPSLYEGFGLPVLEAMAAGTPAITSNVSSLPEVVENAALLVNPNNVDQIADSMKRVLIDIELRNKLCIKGLERAKTLTWEKTADKTLKVFSDLLNEVKV